MGTRTAAFRELVSDHMLGEFVTVPAGTSCAEAVQRMRERGGHASSVIVTGTDGRPLGILTERDVVRRVAFLLAPETPVDEAMSPDPLTIRDNDYLFHAIGVMRRAGLRHMPVVDGDGRVVGMLGLHMALAKTSPQMMDQIDQLTHEDTLDGMKETKAAQVEVAEEMFRDDIPAPEIQALLSHINRDLMSRITRLELREMRTVGRGEAPLPFTVIVMGSCGRGESYINPDQDVGMILADYPDADHGTIDPWFIELGERLADSFDAVGFPYCKGGVMARNPLWRKSISQWTAQIDIWLRRRHDNFIRLADIFFDFRPIHGDAALAHRLRAHVTKRLKGNRSFLRAMYGLEDDRKVALGLFNRFITERNDKAHLGEINLKFTGTLPLVEAVRILALGEGIEETSTLKRIAALHAAGVLSDDEEDYLSGAYEHIAGLLLRKQIADFKATGEVSNYLPPKALSHRERDMLVDSFKAISDLLGRVRSEFTGEIF